MSLFINEWSQGEGTGSREGFTKVRGLVPGDRELRRDKPSLRGRQGVESGDSAPLRVMGHGPFPNKNVQPAFKSYLVLGKRQAPLGWA